MTFETTLQQTFKDDPDKDYINPCCIGGDEILNGLKSNLAVRMNIESDSIEIYQEDWGWALEFLKEEIIYLLAVSNETETGDKQSHIIFNAQAFRKVKGIFFSKTVELPEEGRDFSTIVSQIAAENGFMVN